MALACHRCGELIPSDASSTHCPFCGYNFRTPFAKLRLAVASRLPKYWQAGREPVELMIFGGAAFWLPDTIWHAIRGSHFGGRDVIGLTILMPVALFTLYVLMRKLSNGSLKEFIGLPMMVGVWMLGGFFIGLGGLLSGGYVGRFQDAIYTGLIGLIAPLTFILATYDGTLGALILASLGSIVLLVRASRK